MLMTVFALQHSAYAQAEIKLKQQDIPVVM